METKFSHDAQLIMDFLNIHRRAIWYNKKKLSEARNSTDCSNLTAFGTVVKECLFPELNLSFPIFKTWIKSRHRIASTDENRSQHDKKIEKSMAGLR